MYQAVIDYDPGTHGHFLEYVCNTYIFNSSISESFFFRTGSFHGIEHNEHYKQNKVVNSEHLSYYNKSADESKIIYIKHNPKFDLVLLKNIFHRCFSDNSISARSHDLDPDYVMNWHLSQIVGSSKNHSPGLIKQDLFAKLMERTHFQPEQVQHPSKSVFNFDYGSFFDLADFLQQLQKLSVWLDQVLVVSPELIKLWQNFIEKNQGFQTYQRVNYLIEKILLGQCEPVEDDFFVHAGINVGLARLARVYEPELHSLDSYPTDTQQIHNIVCKHFREYDEKFQ